MKTVLIANRGEIACRVINSCRKLGLKTVAVYSDADKDALHTTMADEAYRIGPPRASDSYLNTEAIIDVLKRSDADAVHPGYGFLSENASFATAVINSGRRWVGPHPRTIHAMGDKEQARQLARTAGVPVLPGSRRFVQELPADLHEQASEVGYPLLVKAAGGGGGIGMNRVETASALEQAVQSTQAVAGRAFRDSTVYLERYVSSARHIEVQIFGFGDGRVIHLFERECSIQRRFQKVIEEAPAPGLPPEVLHRMTSAAVALASSQRYEGAGTVEFIYDNERREFYFLEMNTRIQVEHPVTEVTTGVDLVSLQLRQAAGDELGEISQEAISRNGHAIECRLYAEDPDKKFFPAPGRLDVFSHPRTHNGFRIDTGVRGGDVISPYYDPMVAKLIWHGVDRAAAIAKAQEGLDSIRIEGLRTNLRFLGKILRHPAFAAGELNTAFIDVHRAGLFGI